MVVSTFFYVQPYPGEMIPEYFFKWIESHQVIRGSIQPSQTTWRHHHQMKRKNHLPGFACMGVPAVSFYLGVFVDRWWLRYQLHTLLRLNLDGNLPLASRIFQKKITTNHPQLKDEFQCILFLFWNCYLPYLSSFFPKLPVLWLQECSYIYIYIRTTPLFPFSL